MCKICGQKFIPTSGRQQCCNRPIKRKCIVCGKEFDSTCNAYPVLTCNSAECKHKAKFEHINNSLPERACKQCSEMFVPKTAKQVYCNRIKVKECANCKKEFTYQCCEFIPETCSTSCQAAVTKIRRRNSIAFEERICKFCGTPFKPTEVRQVYCNNSHFKNCVICGKQFEIDVTVDYTVQTCSPECKAKLASQHHDYKKGSQIQKKSLLERYGVENAALIPGAQDKAKQTGLEKYGSEWYSQTQEFKERVKNTCLEKYEVDHHLKSKDVIDKRIKTTQAKYGVDNVFQSAEIKQKSKQTNLEKYGHEYACQSPELIAEIKQRNIAKYGVEHPMMLQAFKDKAIATNVLRYGRKAYTQQHIENIQMWYQFANNPREFIQTHFEEQPRVDQLAEYFGVERTSIDVYLEKENAFDCIKRTKSIMEELIADFIKELNPAVRIIVRNKSEIYPYELDLYFPDFKFAIECNPTCTHNSSVCDPWGSQPKHRNYHRMKSDMCEKRGIDLLHVFGYDWEHKRDVVLSMIRNKLGKSSQIIYARKCNVVKVSGHAAIEFLETNHRQGAANSPIRLGLEYEGQIVSLMTFGKMRRTIGTGLEDLSDCWELVRFCSLLNTSVVGGASKLLKHFVREFSPKRIRSFSDRAHTSGKLYSILGFKEVRRSDPGYVWVNIVDDKAYHRVNAQKKNLKKFLKDDAIDLTKTEREIMIEHGFVQVFDSGTITWELVL